jgi:predicted transcriptional regulator
MSHSLTVELSDELARRARSAAAASNRRLEDAAVDWIGQAVAEQEMAGSGGGPDADGACYCCRSASCGRS